MCFFAKSIKRFRKGLNVVPKKFKFSVIIDNSDSINF